VGAEKSIENINEMGNYKVGDVFITSRTDLDSTWTLANGQLVTNNGSFYELQHKVWLPMDSEISYSGQNFGFSVVPYVYRIEPQGTSNQNLSINVSKYLSTSRQETRQLVAPRAVQMQSWQNNKQEFCWGYFGGKYVWVVGTFGSTLSPMYSVYANFPVSEDSVCYLDGNQIKLNCCDTSFRTFNVNVIIGYIYNLDNYIIVGGNQSNNGDNVYVFLKKPGKGANSLQQVLNKQYSTVTFNSVVILGHPMEGVIYNAKLSAPCLPEISLKNTYAYVKTSSTPT